MRFMVYYNIVNDYIKLFVIVCEKLGTCPCAENLWAPIRFCCQLFYAHIEIVVALLVVKLFSCLGHNF